MGFSQLMMKLRSRGSALCRSSGQTASAFPMRTRATAARACRSASSSLASPSRRVVPGGRGLLGELGLEQGKIFSACRSATGKRVRNAFGSAIHE